MDLRIFIEPQQGTTYSEVAHLARTAERAGFDGFFTSDHLLAMGDTDGHPGPLDAWATLAGLARDTTTIRLGTLVTPITFRHPGLLAVTVAQVDHMSDGRVELGLGTGWYDTEHLAHGIPFPALGERFDRLEEGLEIITGMWDTPAESRFSHAGTHYTVTDSPGLPKPAQSPRPPIVMGGGGPRRTPALAARFADEFNLPFSSPERFAKARDLVSAACREIDRNPDELTWSVAQVLCCGRTEDEFAHHAAAIGREPDELRANGACGLVDEVVARMEAFAAEGVQRVYLQTLDVTDLAHLELVAAEVLPRV